MSLKKMVLAADLGGTNWKLALMQNGICLAQDSLPHRDDRQQLAEVKNRFDQMLTSLGKDYQGCEAWGLSIPEIIDPQTKRVVGRCFKHRYLQDQNIETVFRELIDLPVFVDNDARVALKGELQYGCLSHFKPSVQNALLVTIGTGIGVSALLDGRFLLGENSHGSVPAGHITVDLNGPRCRCGNIGCAEGMASGHGIADNEGDELWFTKIKPATNQIPTFSLLCKQVRAQNKDALQALHRLTDIWSALTVSLIHVYDPGVIVFTGGFMQSADLFFARLEQVVASRIWNSEMTPEFIIAPKPNMSALWGAEAMVLTGSRDTE